MRKKEYPRPQACENPDECKGHPWECTVEQIKKCHGDVKEHPCVEASKES